MELRAPESGVFQRYLAPFTALAGDRRTAHMPGAPVRGIIGSGSLCGSRIAAFSPALAATPQTEAMLAARIEEYGALPPRIAANLGRPVTG